MSSKYISASEINQYLYCPYQWYYERKYGQKYIEKLRKKNGLNAELSNYKKGIEYHERYYKDIVYKRYKKVAIWIAFIFIGIVILIGLLK